MADNFGISEKASPKSRNWGGPRPGSGRPKGVHEPRTLERMRAMKEFQERVSKKADELFNAQFSLATGVQMLFRIDTDEKGNRSKPQLVDDEEEIKGYLDGEYKGSVSEYYFITTERPNNQAIDSLLDRTFGKAQQSVKLGGDQENPLAIILSRYGLESEQEPPKEGE